MLIPLPEIDNVYADYEELLVREKAGEKIYTIYNDKDKRIEKIDISGILEGIEMGQQIEDISIADLKLDLQNPRLPNSKQGDEETVLKYMLLEAAILELMESIGEFDFFTGEPLLVVADENEQGKYIVIDGNRRLTAVLLLNNPELATEKKVAKKKIADIAKFKPTTLPCLVFNNRDEILKYLGFIHITGEKSWRLFEKARYLYGLRNKEQFNTLSFLQVSSEIAKIIGSSTAYVKMLLISFELYKKVENNDFYQIDGLDETTFSLNYFTDSLNENNIRDFINVDINSEKPIENLKTENLEKLINWWFAKPNGQPRVLGDNEELKMLNAVIKDPLALSKFEEGTSIDDAYKLTKHINS
jgi:hypothetical protein